MPQLAPASQVVQSRGGGEGGGGEGGGEGGGFIGVGEGGGGDGGGGDGGGDGMSLHESSRRKYVLGWNVYSASSPTSDSVFTVTLISTFGF